MKHPKVHVLISVYVLYLLLSMIISLFFQTNYYRPQNSDTCYPCDCFPAGSHTRTCDLETGQCPCKPGVIGRQCNRCDNPFAEVTVHGCEGTTASFPDSPYDQIRGAYLIKNSWKRLWHLRRCFFILDFFLNWLADVIELLWWHWWFLSYLRNKSFSVFFHLI